MSCVEPSRRNTLFGRYRSRGTVDAAVRAYIQLMDPQVSEMVKKNIRKDLLTYCAQDTLAMVKLVEVLRERVAQVG